MTKRNVLDETNQRNKTKRNLLRAVGEGLPPGPRPRGRARPPAASIPSLTPPRGGEAASRARGVGARRVSEILSKATLELADDIIGVIEASKYLGRQHI